MRIDQESMARALLALAERAFTLEEVKNIRVRDVTLTPGPCLAEAVCQAVKKSWHDFLSDVDLCVTVRLHPESTVTEETYMERPERFGFGREVCLGRSFIPENRMWRIVLRNGMRYDFGFSFEWNEDCEKLHFPQADESETHEGWPLAKADAFWFVQVQALGKLYRKDYLIADHLAHLMLNETLVQQMVLRDMEHGTNHHRYGYEEAREYERYVQACPFLAGDEKRDPIARKLYAAAMAYDELMRRFAPDGEKRCACFFELWQNCENQNAAEKQEEKTMYCENCQKMTEGAVCPECGRAGREPQAMDAVFLGEKGHPWSDMLCDVLGQEGIPTLRRSTLGAGLMMTIGQYLELESVYVPYDRLEKAREIFDSLFGAAAMPAVPEEEENEEEDEW